MPLPTTIFTEDSTSELAENHVLFKVIATDKSNVLKQSEIRKLVIDRNMLQRVHELTRQSVMTYAAAYVLTIPMMTELQQKGAEIDVNISDGLTPLDYYAKPFSSAISHKNLEKETFFYKEIENKIKHYLGKGELSEIENAKLALLLLSLVRYALARSLKPELTKAQEEYCSLAKDIVEKRLVNSQYQPIVLFHLSLICALQKQTEEADKYLNLARQGYIRFNMQLQAADAAYTCGIVLHYTDCESTNYLATLKSFRFASQLYVDLERFEDALECVQRFHATCFHFFPCRKHEGYDDLLAIVSGFEQKNSALKLMYLADAIMLAYAYKQENQPALKWAENGFEHHKQMPGSYIYFAANCAHLAIKLGQIEKSEKWCEILLDEYKKEFKDKGDEINHCDPKWSIVRGENSKKYQNVFEGYYDEEVLLDQLFKYVKELTAVRDNHGSKNCDRWRQLLDKISNVVGKEYFNVNSEVPISVHERHLIWQESSAIPQNLMNPVQRDQGVQPAATADKRAITFIQENSGSSGRASKRQ